MAGHPGNANRVTLNARPETLTLIARPESRLSRVCGTVPGMHMPEIPCYGCGVALDCSIRLPDDRPVIGNGSVCFYCGAIGIFDIGGPAGALTIRPPTLAELVEIRDDPEFRQAVRAVSYEPTDAHRANLARLGSLRRA